VFTRAKVVVFVDGCFWHGCPDHGTTPTNNAAWWREKLAANIARDLKNTKALVALGWTVVRIWEHEQVNVAVLRVKEAITAARPP
jgi:DNA mismatch endonuclease (patch repair protein)